MTDGDLFRTLHINQVQADLLKLYERIACEKGRVDIVHEDGAECRCVLISKAELDSLERTIELLSDHDGVRAMRECLAQVIAGSGPMNA